MGTDTYVCEKCVDQFTVLIEPRYNTINDSKTAYCICTNS